MNEASWSREAWDSSVSSRAYNSDWWANLTPEKEPELWAELRSVFEDEMAAPEIPGWASDVVVRMMELPMCGYYAFPANVTQIIDAISAGRCPDVVMRCYTVDPGRKRLLSYYVYCLDAWLKDAPFPVVLAELAMRDQLDKDWEGIASAIYGTLGEKGDVKRITVERLVHRLRWWIKSLIWSGDKRDMFLLDVYSGDVRGDEPNWGAYGNSPYGDPYFAELDLPHVKAMEERIRADAPDGKMLVERIRSTWLCAPKAFRYLEKLIVEIGAIDSDAAREEASAILQCEDTYPDFEANHEHFVDLVRRLRSWLDGEEGQIPSLGPSSPVGRWLVHLLWHKLVFHARYEENFAKLVGERPHGRSGSKRPDS
ncbi:hypothetical protein ACFLSJ_02795 [Verrucomicrobiota bacterium]